MNAGVVELQLPVRQPYDVGWARWFLRGHAVAGLESVDGDRYTRVVSLPGGNGIVTVDLGTAPLGHLATTLHGVAAQDPDAASALLRHLLGLDADPLAPDAALARDPRLAPLVAAAPGLRVFGCVDPAELLLRTMIGQQISVAAAATHQARLVAALGAPVDDPDGRVHRAFPTPSAIAERGADVLTGPRARIAAIVGAAAALADGRLELHPGLSRADTRAALLALRGVGPWTADYVSMRLLADPDVLLASDLVIRQGAALIDLDITANRWSPFGSSVTMHLWNHALVASGRKPA